MPDVLQLCRGIIRVASWLAPRAGREDWRREWLAEVEARPGQRSPGLALRCAGAAADAAWLRVDSLRQGFWGDVRLGARLLARSPGFALSAILALALGIGANTALFSAIHTLLWRTAPVTDPDTLIAVYTSDYSRTQFGSSSFPEFAALSTEARTLASVAAVIGAEVRGQFGEESEQLEISLVSGSYLRTIGVAPIAGHGITQDGESAAMISEALWERRYGRNPAVLGQTIVLNGRALPIVGVMPRGFTGTTLLTRPDVWAPLRQVVDVFGSRESVFHDKRSRGLDMVARLAPGASAVAAQAELDVLARGYAAADRAAWTDARGAQRRMTVLPLREAGFDPDARDNIRQVAMLAFGVVGMLLVIVCATVATMLLARAQSRRREMGIRLAIGAERMRLLRQLLTETGLLCVVGGALGIVLAQWCFGWLNQTRELWADLRGMELQLEPWTLLYALAVVLASTMIAGAAPAWRASRQHVMLDIKDDSIPAGSRLDRSWAASLFVTGQIALSLTLLMAGALLIRTIVNLQSTYPGFSMKDVLLARVQVGTRNSDPHATASMLRALQEHLAATPGVSDVAMASNAMLSGRFGRRRVPVEGYQYAPGEKQEFHIQFASPGYFRTLGIPLLAGRDFSWQDGPDKPRIAIVNDVFAQQYWPNQSPIGRRLLSGTGTIEVVGVAAPSKFGRVSDPAMPMIFLPLTQEPRGGIIAHTKVASGYGIGPVELRQRLREFDRTLFTPLILPYEELVARTTLPERFAAMLAAAAGLLALFLSALGLYGVLSHAVTQSTREIGVRVAIGASRADVFQHVFGRVVRLFVPGALVGVAGAFLFGQLLAGWLFGIQPSDPISLMVSLALLATVTLVAAWLPARRALRIQPLEALRYQ